jgi:hypothetical protein
LFRICAILSISHRLMVTVVDDYSMNSFDGDIPFGIDDSL